MTQLPHELISYIRVFLQLTISDLARLLGVSRQTIYDWQNGKKIAAHNAARLADLARVPDVFAAEGLTISAQLLRRPIASGKSVFDIAREGGSAEEAARKLIQTMRREMRQRQMLADHLKDRYKPEITDDVYGIPILNEMG